jgi:octaprenyl-diphosphate synthase
MVDLIEAREFTPSQFQRLIALLKKNGGIAYTRQNAVRHVDKAKAALDVFPMSSERTVLQDIADYALWRSA